MTQDSHKPQYTGHKPSQIWGVDIRTVDLDYALTRGGLLIYDAADPAKGDWTALGGLSMAELLRYLKETVGVTTETIFDALYTLRQSQSTFSIVRASDAGYTPAFARMSVRFELKKAPKTMRVLAFDFFGQDMCIYTTSVGAITNAEFLPESRVDKGGEYLAKVFMPQMYESEPGESDAMFPGSAHKAQGYMVVTADTGVDYEDVLKKMIEATDGQGYGEVRSRMARAIAAFKKEVQKGRSATVRAPVVVARHGDKWIVPPPGLFYVPPLPPLRKDFAKFDPPHKGRSMEGHNAVFISGRRYFDSAYPGKEFHLRYWTPWVNDTDLCSSSIFYNSELPEDLLQRGYTEFHSINGKPIYEMFGGIGIDDVVAYGDYVAVVPIGSEGGSNLDAMKNVEYSFNDFFRRAGTIDYTQAAIEPPSGATGMAAVLLKAAAEETYQSGAFYIGASPFDAFAPAFVRATNAYWGAMDNVDYVPILNKYLPYK